MSKTVAKITARSQRTWASGPSPRGTSKKNDGIVLIGAPSAGFTVAGRGFEKITGKSVAAMVSTDLAAAWCYNKPGGFVLVETDPESLAAIKSEIDLSNSPLADPTTRLTNRYVPPGLFVRGSWTSDGTNVTVKYEVVDARGKLVATSNRWGPFKDLSDLSGKATNDLADTLSGGNWDSQLPKAA
jgi:hypothetical protein